MDIEDRKSRTHLRLLEALIDTVGSRGLQATSAAQVSATAGVARSTFYQHFSGTDECFRAAHGELAARLLETVATTCVAAADPIDALVDLLVGWAVEHEAQARMVFVGTLAAGREGRVVRDRLQHQIAAVLEETTRPASAEALHDMPVSILVAGIFRLLAITLWDPDGSLDAGVARGLREWVGAYAAPPSSAPAVPADELRQIGPLSLDRLSDPPAGASPQRSPFIVGPGRALDQRMRVMAAVVTCSCGRGYSEVKVADITAAAGISRRVFYSHFRDKSDAATQTNQTYFQEAMAEVAGAFFAASSWPERIWAAGRALLGFLSAQPERSYLAFVETHAIGDGAVRLTYDRLSAFTLFLEEGYALRPRARQPSRAISEALKATMFEVAFQELNRRRSADRLFEQLPLLTYLVLAPFLGVDDARGFVAEKVDVPYWTPREVPGWAAPNAGP